MKIHSATFCLLLALIVHFTSQGQYFKNYNSSKGLVSNHIYQVNCDRKGYVWICTDKGVVRFNGKNFETFTVSNGLTDNEVYNCYEDMYGRMWFYTFNGEFCYYKNGIIYNKDNDLFLRKLGIYSFVNTIYENISDSSLYFGHIYGPIQKIKNQTINVINAPLTPHSKIRTIIPMLNGLRVTSLMDDLIIKNDSITKWVTHQLNNSFYYNDRLIIADNKGVSLYDRDSLVWKVIDPDVQYGGILNIFYDGKGYVFCGTNKGLIVYNIYTSKKRLFFENIKVSSSRTDADGNYWISTFGHGLYYFSKANLDDIQIIKNIKGYDLIQASSGQIFLKKYDRIQILKKIGTVLKFDKIKFGIPEHAEPVLNNNDILYYYELTDGGKSYSVNTISGKRSQLKEQFFKAYKIAEKDFVLFSSNNIIRTNLLKGKEYQFIHHFIKDRLSSQVYIKELNAIYYISGKNILYKYKYAESDFQLIDSIHNIASCNTIFYNDAKIYVSGNNGYVYIYDAVSNKRIGKIKPEVVVYDVVKIQNGIFLANTDNGYKLLNIEKDIFSFSNIQYPIFQNDILSISSIDNQLICKAGDDLYSFSADILNTQVTKPALYIQSVTINNKKTVDDLVKVEVIDKAHLDILLSTVYYGCNKLIYRYRITENDIETGEWHLTQGEQVSFSFNSNGDYKIEMQVAESGGEFSGSNTVFLKITPSFLKSVYFKLICFIAIIVVAFFIIRLVHQKRKTAFANEMNFLKLEHRATSALLNPHFIFNAINNIQNLINQNSKELAREYLATLSVMIRQNIDNLQFHLIPLKKEIELIENYIELQNLRFNHSIHFELKNEVTIECFVPPLLIQTFVENAIIHGYDKLQENFQVCISVIYSIDDYLTITIRDNGRGINSTSKSQQIYNKSSLGISFTEKRLKRLSIFCKKEYKLQIIDLAYRNNQESGTEVTIVIYARMMEFIERDK